MPKAFLARILMNLKVIYLKLEDFSQAVATLDKLLILAPRQYQQKRDRGILHYELKNYELARQDLEEYLQRHPQASDGATIQQILDRINR